jgi:predicted PurR-regulated permease PerM
MSPTLGAIVFIAGVFLIAGFLLLVATLVPTIIQLKSLLKDLEKTSSEARELAANLKSISGKVEEDIVTVEHIIDSTKESVDVVKNALKQVDKSFIKKSAGLLALIPAIRFGWHLVKKHKRR